MVCLNFNKFPGNKQCEAHMHLKSFKYASSYVAMSFSVF